MIPPWIRDLGGADPYAVLEVDREASTQAISQAYLKLIKVAHPDLPTGDEEKAKLLGLARDILTDPAKRAAYNRFADTGSAQIDTGTSSVWDDDDITAGVMNSPVASVGEPSTRRSRPSGRQRRYGLGLGALGASVMCGPAGLVMGIVALSSRRPSDSDRICAWISLGVGTAQIALCCLLGDALLSTLDPTIR